MLKKLHINIPFIDALSQKPMYAEFFKEVLSKKRKINEHETFAVGEECSVMVPKSFLPSIRTLVASLYLT